MSISPLFRWPNSVNHYTLDTATLGENVDLSQPVKQVVPTREALVLADYETSVGYRALLTMKHNGQPVPFGAMVSAGSSQGITGENGQVYLSGLADGATLTVGLAGGRSCSSTFSLAEATKSNGIVMSEMKCI